MEVLVPFAGMTPVQYRARYGTAIGRQAVLITPLVLVNSAAIYGQVRWAAEHLTGGTYSTAILFALTLESIAIYLAYEAHQALLAGDASFRLRTASYLAAGVVGALNYSHFANDDLSPTTAAVAFGMLSAASPWLWSIRSRSMRRDQLRTAGLIDPRSAHFSAAKWVNFPLRTMRAYRWSVDHGVQEERAAWDTYRHITEGTATGIPEDSPWANSTPLKVQKPPRFIQQSKQASVGSGGSSGDVSSSGTDTTNPKVAAPIGPAHAAKRKETSPASQPKSRRQRQRKRSHSELIETVISNGWQDETQAALASLLHVSKTDVVAVKRALNDDPKYRVIHHYSPSDQHKTPPPDQNPNHRKPIVLHTTVTSPNNTGTA